MIEVVVPMRIKKRLRGKTFQLTPSTSRSSFFSRPKSPSSISIRIVKIRREVSLRHFSSQQRFSCQELDPPPRWVGGGVASKSSGGLTLPLKGWELLKKRSWGRRVCPSCPAGTWVPKGRFFSEKKFGGICVSSFPWETCGFRAQLIFAHKKI